MTRAEGCATDVEEERRRLSPARRDFGAARTHHGSAVQARMVVGRAAIGNWPVCVKLLASKRCEIFLLLQNAPAGTRPAGQVPSGLRRVG
jgi:hypothetical protein